jgi:hypothetical protein
VDRGEGYSVDKYGANRVEEDLEGAEEGFSKKGIEEESLEAGGEVGIETVNAEGFMVR